MRARSALTEGACGSPRPAIQAAAWSCLPNTFIAWLCRWSLFNPKPEAAVRGARGGDRERVQPFSRIDKVTARLDGNRFLNGVSLSAADIYAYVVLSWTGYMELKLPAAAQTYFDALKANEHIQKAHAALAGLQ